MSLNTKQTMKQYRQHRQTNEQTRTTEYIAPVCNTYLQHRQTDRQTDNRTQTTDILATDSQVRYPFAMSIKIKTIAMPIYKRQNTNRKQCNLR